VPRHLLDVLCEAGRSASFRLASYGSVVANLPRALCVRETLARADASVE
jgi:hypothetical protein